MVRARRESAARRSSPAHPRSWQLPFSCPGRARKRLALYPHLILLLHSCYIQYILRCLAQRSHYRSICEVAERQPKTEAQALGMEKPTSSRAHVDFFFLAGVASFSRSRTTLTDYNPLTNGNRTLSFYPVLAFPYAYMFSIQISITRTVVSTIHN